MVYLEANKGIFPKITNGTPTSVQFVNQVTKQKFNPEILRVNLSHSLMRLNLML